MRALPLTLVIAMATLWRPPLSAAATSPASLQLAWQVPDGCPGRAEAERAITAALAKSGTFLTPVALLSVTITRGAGGRFAARVAIVDARGSGERVYDGASCERVAEAAELIASLALEESDIAERSVRDDASASLREPHVSLGLRVFMDIGSLPNPSAGLGTSLGLRSGRLYTEAQVMAWLPSFSQASADRRSGGEIGLYGVGIRACYPQWMPFDGALSVAPCLGGEAGLTTGRGVNFQSTFRTNGYWAATFAGISLQQVVRSGPQATFSIEAGAPVVRPEFVVDDAGERVRVFRAAPVVGRAWLGIAWLLP